MKTKHLFSLLLVLTLGTFASCDLFDKIDDVTFEADVPVDFFVASLPTSNSFSDDVLLNINSHPDIAEYADKIKEITIDRVTYTITNSTSAGYTFTGSITSAGGTVSSVSAISINNTAETDLPANLDGFNTLANNLLNDKEENIGFSGQFSNIPVQFNLRLRFYFTVKADAL